MPLRGLERRITLAFQGCLTQICKSDGQSLLMVKINLLLNKLYAWGVMTPQNLPRQEFMIRSPSEVAFGHLNFSDLLQSPIFVQNSNLYLQKIVGIMTIFGMGNEHLYLLSIAQLWSNKSPEHLRLTTMYLLPHNLFGSGIWAQLGWVLYFMVFHKFAVRGLPVLRSYLKVQMGKDPSSLIWL